MDVNLVVWHKENGDERWELCGKVVTAIEQGREREWEVGRKRNKKSQEREREGEKARGIERDRWKVRGWKVRDMRARERERARDGWCCGKED